MDKTCNMCGEVFDTKDRHICLNLPPKDNTNDDDDDGEEEHDYQDHDYEINYSGDSDEEYFK